MGGLNERSRKADKGDIGMNNFEDKKQKAILCRMVRKITAFAQELIIIIANGDKEKETELTQELINFMIKPQYNADVLDIEEINK